MSKVIPFPHGEDESNAPAQAKKEKFSIRGFIRRYRQIDLPDALREKMVKQFIGAGAFGVFSVVLAIYEKNPSYLLGLIISLLFFALAISTKTSFGNGSIIEVPMICQSVNYMKVRKMTRIVFADDADNPHYYEFYYPGKNADQFLEGNVYVLYYNPSEPKTLIGFTAL